MLPPPVHVSSPGRSRHVVLSATPNASTRRGSGGGSAGPVSGAAAVRRGRVGARVATGWVDAHPSVRASARTPYARLTVTKPPSAVVPVELKTPASARAPGPVAHLDVVVEAVVAAAVVAVPDGNDV